MTLRTERHSARMPKIKNSGLDQYGAGPFEQQQFGAAGVEGVNEPRSLGLILMPYLRIVYLYRAGQKPDCF